QRRRFDLLFEDFEVVQLGDRRAEEVAVGKFAAERALPAQTVGHWDVEIRQAAGRVPITALHDTRTFVTHPFRCPAFGFARAFGKQVRVHVVYGIERAIGLHAFAVTGPRRIGEPDEIAHAT